MAAKRSEDVIADKWDRCIVDTTIKTISGATIGGILSLTSLGKTTGGMRWPLLVFTSVGFGLGLGNFNNELKYPKLLKGAETSK